MTVEVSTALGPVSGLLRVLRGSLVGIVMMFAGLLGHVSAGGLLPGVPWLATLLGLNLLVALLVLGRPISVRFLVLLIVGGQAAGHVVLTLTAGHVGESAGPIIQVIDGKLLYASDWHHLLAEFSTHAPMMMAHLMAGATVGMWLGVGERALWALIAGAHARLIRPLIVLRSALAAVRAPAHGVLLARPEIPVMRPAVAVLARSVVRRGPPLVLAA